MPDLAELFTIRGIGQTTALVFLEAVVWTEVSYLPHWLLVTSTLLAAVSIVILNAEPWIRRATPALASVLSLGVLTLFFASVGYAFFGNLSGPPYAAKVRTLIQYVGDDPINLFMIEYESPPRGKIASPLTYLMDIELTNRQDFSVAIDKYSLAVSRWHYSPWWQVLPPIPLAKVSLVVIGIGPPSNQSWKSNKLLFPAGTYRLEGRPQYRQELSQTRRINLSSFFEEQVQKPLAAHKQI